MSLQKLNAEFAPAPVRALLVDMDGVLFDTERRSLLSIIDIIGRQGLTITYDQLVERMGLGPKDLRRSYETLLGPAFQWQLFWDTYWAERRAFYDEHGMPVMPGVVETLTAARKKGLACILASSSPRDQVIAHLKHAHVYDYFTDVVGGDMFEHSKPQPAGVFRRSHLRGYGQKEQAGPRYLSDRRTPGQAARGPLPGAGGCGERRKIRPRRRGSGGHDSRYYSLFRGAFAILRLCGGYHDGYPAVA